MQFLRYCARCLNERVGILLLMASAFGFSVVSAVAKACINNGMTPMGVLLARNLGQVISNLLPMLYYQMPLYPKMSFRESQWLFGRAAFGTYTVGVFYWTLDHLSYADATVCLFTSAVFTSFLAALILREPILYTHMLGAFLSLAGVICIARPEDIFGATTPLQQVVESSWPRPLSIGIGLTGAAGQSMAFISMRKLKAVPRYNIILFYGVFASLGSLVALYFQYENLRFLDLPIGVQLGVMSLGPIAFLSQVAVTKGLHLEAAGPASIIRTVDIVFAFLWQIFLFHESIVPWSVLGGALVLSSAVIIAATNKSPGAKELKQEPLLLDETGSEMVALDLEKPILVSTRDSAPISVS